MFFISLNSMLALFLCMFVGFIGMRIKLFNDDIIKGFNKLLLNITVPAMFISAMNITVEKSLVRNGFYALVGGFVFHILALLIALFIVKLFKVKHKSLWLFALTFANIGFLGFPLISDLFGSDALFYTALINVSFYVLIFSIGVYVISNGKTTSFKQIFLSKPFIGTMIGIIIFIIPYSLPIFVSKTVYMFGNITPPLSMLVVGATFAKSNTLQALMKKEIYVIAFIKLIVIPVAIFFLFKLVVPNEDLVVVFTILSATPSAILSVIMAKEYGNDEIYASEIVFVTTLLSIITLPLITTLIT